MKITVLGCGSSGGVPTITGEWGACDPTNPKNNRRRSSLLLEIMEYKLLVDTSPDLRLQLLDAGVDRIDGVLFTHAHADHIMGLDELRQIYMKHRQVIPVYGDQATLTSLRETFGYAMAPKDENYISFIHPHEVTGNFDFHGINITPIPLNHGNIQSLGYRIGNFAYCTDFKFIPEESKKLLHDLELWIVDCLRFDPHPTHIHFEGVMALIEMLKPERAVLTHLTQWMDYDHLASLVPRHVEPAYDGMALEMSDNHIL